MTVVGVIGGGQLARMMIPAAINLGIELRVLAETENSSARSATTMVGDYRDLNDLRAFSRGIDVLTFDHEHVPLSHLRKLREQGLCVYPPPEALALTQDKAVMREMLASWGVPQPRWALIDHADERALAAVGGFPCVAKLPVGGYDGKGVRVVSSWGDFEDWFARGVVLLEEKVPFARELAQISARRPSGEWEPWPTVETVQENGMCSLVRSPADGLTKAQESEARRIAHNVAVSAGVVGVLAVELFELPSGELLVNELAMRPHNSGHVFTEHSVTSQFEQHLRAVTDTPLGATRLREPIGTMANLLGHADYSTWGKVAGEFPAVKFHSYQKEPRPGRKAGHIVAIGDNRDTVDRMTLGARESYVGSI